MRRTLFISLMLAAPALWSQADPEADRGSGQGIASPAQIVADCSKSDDEDALGLPALEASCPGLEHALVQLGYASFISESQLDELTVHSLVDLQRLAERYREPPAGTAGEIDLSSLGPIVQSLQQDPRAEQSLTLLQRFRNWLRSAFDRPANESQSWLTRWLDDVKIPQAISRGIVYGAIILIIVLAIAVLVNELRAAGLLRRGTRAGKNAAITADGTRDPALLSLADLEQIPPQDRPSVLLRMLVATLVKTGRLRAERSLTHRELASRATFDEPTQREDFRRVAVLGEQVVYGDRVIADDEVASIIEAGRALQMQLVAQKTASGGATA